MNDTAVIEDSVTVIKPRSGWSMQDLKELREYGDLLYFLVWRDIKVLYAQTILGFAWAILNPLVQIVIFSIIFGRIAQLPSEGVPYIVFSTLAVIPWTYMSSTMGTGKPKFGVWAKYAWKNILPKNYLSFKLCIFKIG